MIVTKPIEITDAMLTSNIPEPDTGEVVWVAGTYSTGDEVISLSTHRKYKSAVDSNTVDPDSETYDDKGIGANWVIIGSSNRFAMFDGVIGRQSTQDNQIVIEINTVAPLDSVSVFNVYGTLAEITLTDPVAGVVYNQSVDLRDNTAVVDYYEYFYEPIIEVTEFALNDLPIYPAAIMKIDITAIGLVSVGELAIGKQFFIGDTQRGTAWNPSSNSRRERDEFGNFYILKRRSSDYLDYKIQIDRARLPLIKRTLSALIDEPCVWFGTDDVSDGTFVYGYYKDLRLIWNGPTRDDMSLTVEGLI